MKIKYPIYVEPSSALCAIVLWVLSLRMILDPHRIIEVLTAKMKYCSCELTESLATISGSFGSDFSLGGDVG